MRQIAPLLCIHRRQVAGTNDRRQNVVKVMCDTTRKLPHGLQRLRAHNLITGRARFGNIPSDTDKVLNFSFKPGQRDKTGFCPVA